MTTVCRSSSLATLLAWLAILLGLRDLARAAVLDFSAPLQNVEVSVSSSSVQLQVFDPALSMVKVVNVPSGPTFDLINTNGVVCWSSGPTVQSWIYDPARTNWMGSSVSSGATSNLRSRQGVVVWSSGSTVHQRVYDPIRGAWMVASVSSGITFDLRTAQGVVAWSSSSSTVHFRIYDPSRGAWVNGSVNSGATFDLSLESGLVAWSSGAFVHYAAYDPTRSGWTAESANTGSTFDLKNASGVVAWSSGATVSFRAYDPGRGTWMGGSVNSGPPANLANSAGTITWTAGSTAFTRGYDHTSGAWHAGPTLPLAYFAVSTNAGNAPLLVQFIDMSVGALSWSWSFGDGGSSPSRSPFHRFTAFQRNNVTQTVAGSSGNHAASRPVLSDITPPTGSVLINNGAPIATTNIVTLTLAATDNSGTVTGVRFSNDGSVWSEWETFALSKSWQLTSGNDQKQVFAQFRDLVENASTPASDFIFLDATPIPTVGFSVSNTNVTEGAGTATLFVVLSSFFTREVTVDYATANGTATAGSDYAAASGRILFQPGQTMRSFSVTISNDARVELNETVRLLLSNPTNAVLGPEATLTLIDDDAPAVMLASATATVNENEPATLITVNLSGASGLRASVNYTATGGTATAGSDFTPVTRTLVFEPGETNRTFAVSLLDDTVDESQETILLGLSSPTNAVLGAPAAGSLTLLDDDPPVIRFSATNYVAGESAGSLAVHVWLSTPYNQTVFADYMTTAGSASPGSDYIEAVDTLVFAEGQTNKTFVITLLPDSLAETNETIRLSLFNLVNATPGASVNATVTVVDDDRPLWRSPRRLANGAFSATISGPLAQRLAVEASTNLLNWSSVATVTNQTGTTEFIDPAAVNFPQRFYRSQVLPF